MGPYVDTAATVSELKENIRKTSTQFLVAVDNTTIKQKKDTTRSIREFAQVTYLKIEGEDEIP